MFTSIIALLYGVAPFWFARTFLGVDELSVNLAHILRAVMCLYLALGLFWLYSAFNDRLRDTAILTTMVFAGGLVATVQEHVMPVRSGVMPVKPPAMFTNVGSGRFGRQHIELSKDQALYEQLTSSRHVDLACGPTKRGGKGPPSHRGRASHRT